jgi:hypothetical protein
MAKLLWKDEEPYYNNVKWLMLMTIDRTIGSAAYCRKNTVNTHSRKKKKNWIKTTTQQDKICHKVKAIDHDSSTVCDETGFI